MQVQAKANAAGGLALEAIENVNSGMGFVLRVVIREIVGDVVGADGFNEVVVTPLRRNFLQVLRLVHDGSEGRVALASIDIVAEERDEVLARRRDYLVERPEDDKNDEDESPEIILLHGLEGRDGWSVERRA